jgi:hypothetical protein
VIFGWNWRLIALFGPIAWVWLAGCGPKPIDLWVEPPQPMISVQTMEIDEAKKPMAGGDDDTSTDANASNATNADAAAEPHLIHKVRWGHETLYSISIWYTGKGHNWRRIAAANPKIKPRRMRIGDTIRIPWSLLTRRRPMPENFLNSAATRKHKKSSDPIPSSPSQGHGEQVPPLYGPVEDDAPAPTEKHNELPVPLETLDD